MEFNRKKKGVQDFDSSVFIADGAVVVGNVEIGRDSSVWFNSVLRADADVIRIGEGSNIQDGSVIHVDPGFPVEIGNHVIIGHKCIIHGAKVDDNSLIGMGSTLLNGVKVGKFCLIGANSLLTEGMEIPDGMLVLGSPAKIIKPISDIQKQKIIKNASVYMELKNRYLGL